MPQGPDSSKYFQKRIYLASYWIVQLYKELIRENVGFQQNAL